MSLKRLPLRLLRSRSLLQCPRPASCAARIPPLGKTSRRYYIIAHPTLHPTGPAGPAPASPSALHPSAQSPSYPHIILSPVLSLPVPGTA